MFNLLPDHYGFSRQGASSMKRKWLCLLLVVLSL